MKYKATIDMTKSRNGLENLCGGAWREKWEVCEIETNLKCVQVHLGTLFKAVKKEKFVLSKYLNFYSSCHSRCVFLEEWMNVCRTIRNAI